MSVDTIIDKAKTDIGAILDKAKDDIKAIPPSPPVVTPPEPTPVPPEPTPPPVTGGLDRFGIKKVYPDAATPVEWAVNMNDPASTSNFKNLPKILKLADGSFQTSESQVRMEAWSPVNKKWLNVEITAYQKLVSGADRIFQMYSRGGHHSSLSPERSCWGSAYKAALWLDGSSECRKEVNHPAYCSNRAKMKATTKPLLGKWVGFKQVIYNYLLNGKTFVKIETYIDDNVNDANSNLVIKNEWRKVSETKDEGGWTTTETDFNPACPRLNKDQPTGFRARDEIMSLPGNGETAGQNLAAWRTDGSTNNWKFLSVREITPPG